MAGHWCWPCIICSLIHHIIRWLWPTGFSENSLYQAHFTKHTLVTKVWWNLSMITNIRNNLFACPLRRWPKFGANCHHSLSPLVRLKAESHGFIKEKYLKGSSAFPVGLFIQWARPKARSKVRPKVRSKARPRARPKVRPKVGKQDKKWVGDPIISDCFQ